jgi:CubicO group peptidase (beta-lactamase class C family)
MKKSVYFLALIILFLSSCGSGTDNENKSTAVLVNKSAVSRIDSTLKSFVESGDIAGVSALIFEKGREVYFNAFGYSDREAKILMSRNTIVQIFSMTKPITGTALMTLYEKGAFQLDDPVSKYAPEFGNMKVFAGVDPTGKMILVNPERPMTIRDLTRHTAGFGSNTDHPLLGKLINEADALNSGNTLSVMAQKLGSVPLWFHPGSKWEYGPAVDVQAFLVERISNMAYDKYLKKNILDPLGMTETRYFVPESDRKRFAASYNRSDEGVLTRMPDETAHAYNIKEWPLKRGGAGLTSTIDDYMRFARMLQNKGSLEGVTVLKPETVQLMATNQLSDSIKDRSWLPSKGQVGFGIDFAVRLRPPASAAENNGAVGEFFWDGAASTLFWVDPVNDLTAVLFVQLFPFDKIGLHKKFRDAVYGPYNPEK